MSAPRFYIRRRLCSGREAPPTSPELEAAVNRISEMLRDWSDREAPSDDRE